MAFRSKKQKKYAGIQEYYLGKKNSPALALYIQWRNLEGKNIKQKLDTTNLEDAREILEKKKRSVSEEKVKISLGIVELRQDVINHRITLDQMAALFYEDRNTKNNINDQQKYDKHISPVLGKMRLAAIKRKEVEKLQNVLEKKGLAPKSINNLIDHLRSMFNVGMDEDNNWCDHNPVNRKKVKKLVVDTEPGRVLDDEELELMFTTFRDGDYERDLPKHPVLHLFSKLLYHTGSRPAAILPLTVGDINFKESTVKIISLKGGKGYKAKLKPETIALIREWITEHDLKRTDCLFYPQQTFQRTRKGKNTYVKYTGLSRASRRYFDPLFNTDELGEITDAQDRVMLYSLRRTGATRVYKKYGIVEAKNFLRHTDVKTTMHYLNITNDDMAEVIDAL